MPLTRPPGFVLQGAQEVRSDPSFETVFAV